MLRIKGIPGLEETFYFKLEFKILKNHPMKNLYLLLIFDIGDDC